MSVINVSACEHERCRQARVRLSGPALASVLAASCSIVLSSGALAAPIKINGVFSEHMVVQSGQPLVVYGTATPGEPIGVKLAEKKAVAITNDKGDWSATLEAVPAGGPYELQVVGAQEKIVITDVMAGEVWLCSGQSNMLMSLKQAGLESKREAISTGDSSIRLLKVGFGLAKTPQRKLDAKWVVLDRENAANCAAIPFVFATELRKKLNTPVGIIVSASDGARCDSWISTAGLSKMPEGRSKLAGFEEQYDTFMAYREQKIINQGEKINDVESWDREANAIFNHGLNAVPAPPGAALYNAMIAPLVPYTIRGVLWYQGEINITRPDTYEKYFTTLMHDWRRKWKKPHLPFLFVQLPPVGERLDMPASVSKAARLRDAQTKASLLPYTFMVSAVDTINKSPADWHGSDKQLIGKRLAQMALATQYKKPGPFKGPSMESVTLEGSKVRVHFRNATHGLTVKGDVLKGFAIAGEDKKLIWASSQIDGDSVLVWSNHVPKPSLVTYAWADNPDGNLYNGDDLPAVPFRSQVTHGNTP
jgi:sialate O-acetylesterase